MDRQQPGRAGQRPVATEFAPAKVNLALHVIGRRGDGYHLLESLVVFPEFGDRLSFEAAGEDGLVVTGPYADGVPADGRNLVVAARETLREAALERGKTLSSSPDLRFARRPGERDNVLDADPLPPVLIHLEKNLPVASGIGGGSSDAAATLYGLNRFWSVGLAPEELAELGSSLGADVPMCLLGTPLIARGIGDVIEPLAAFPRLPMVLVNPRLPVATPAVFAALACRSNPPLPTLPGNLDFAVLRAWLAGTRNDLEQPAIGLVPSIAEVLSALRHNGAAFARMSGSGATCFGLFASTAAAATAAQNLQRARPGWFVISTLAG